MQPSQIETKRACNELELENDAVSSVYDMAGDDKERMVYEVGIYT